MNKENAGLQRTAITTEAVLRENEALKDQNLALKNRVVELEAEIVKTKEQHKQQSVRKRMSRRDNRKWTATTICSDIDKEQK